MGHRYSTGGRIKDGYWWREWRVLASGRYFPNWWVQSFEFSTLGGWVATRAAGHFATGPTHIDDLVTSVRVITPSGKPIETRHVPSSGAGPSENAIFVGSEGTLGIITQAWVSVRPLPKHRASATVSFDANGSFVEASYVLRAMLHTGIKPANCRLVQRGEALTSGLGDGDADVLILGFESADLSAAAELERALRLCHAHGGQVTSQAHSASADGVSGEGAVEAARRRNAGEESWRRQFIDAPYLRDAIVRAGYIAETFETCWTWRNWPRMHAAVVQAVEAALRAHCAAGRITCRITHCYPEGPAPYYTVLAAPGSHGDRLAQWDAVKAAASEAILAGGGTASHHHAVGKMHRPWYALEVSDRYDALLRALKAELDPRGIMNPGVLITSDRYPSAHARL